MDWSKAKNILIFIFLALNIFLFVNISLFYFGGRVSQEDIDMTVKILENRGYALSPQCEIPVYQSLTSKLSFDNAGYDKTTVVENLLNGADSPSKTLDGKKEFTEGSKRLVFKDKNTFVYEDGDPEGQVDISDEDEVETYVKGFLENLKIKANSYMVDVFRKEDSDAVRIEMIEKYQRFLIFDNRIKALVSPKGILQLECTGNKVEGLTKPRYEIMPAHQVLIKNLKHGNNNIIQRIDIGYKIYGSPQDAKETLESPAVWRIKMQDGTEQYYNAYDGAEIEYQ